MIYKQYMTSLRVIPIQSKQNLIYIRLGGETLVELC